MITPIVPITGTTGTSPNSPVTLDPGGSVQPSFGSYLQSALNQVTDLQTQSDKAIELAGAGAGPDVHTVMIQMEQAKLALDLTVQIRNKAVEAYQEIMRMQM
ncbi:MAG: flagellar hook-basal body complex protein FliE [Bacilli bacterium]|nr:flagellar hook-basal body complex protein FliE [Bacilli bacterium]